MHILSHMGVVKGVPQGGGVELQTPILIYGWILQHALPLQPRVLTVGAAARHRSPPFQGFLVFLKFGEACLRDWVVWERGQVQGPTCKPPPKCNAKLEASSMYIILDSTI